MPPRPDARPKSPGGPRAGIETDVRRIVAEENYELLVERAEVWGGQLAENNLRMAQIRRVFGEVKRLQMRWEPSRLRMLRPRLAYVAARAGQGGQLLREILTPAIDTVFQAPAGDQARRFKVLADLFEAMLAHYTQRERGEGRREV